MNKRVRVVFYIVLRIAFFVVPLIALLLLGVEEIFAAIYATLIGLLLSLMLLGAQRQELSGAISDMRVKSGELTQDEEIEDALLEAKQSKRDSNSPQ